MSLVATQSVAKILGLGAKVRSQRPRMRSQRRVAEASSCARHPASPHAQQFAGEVRCLFCGLSVDERGFPGNFNCLAFRADLQLNINGDVKPGSNHQPGTLELLEANKASLKRVVGAGRKFRKTIVAFGVGDRSECSAYGRTVRSDSDVGDSSAGVGDVSMNGAVGTGLSSAVASVKVRGVSSRTTIQRRMRLERNRRTFWECIRGSFVACQSVRRKAHEDLRATKHSCAGTIEYGQVALIAKGED